MTAKKRTIIEKGGDLEHPDRVIVEESIDPKDQPAVMAYRLSSLEDAVRTQTSRFDELVKGFVTEKELTEAQARAKEQHQELWDALNGIKNATRWWVGTAVAIFVAIATWVSATRNG